jgi:alkylhydroperoxidase family enzyme
MTSFLGAAPDSDGAQGLYDVDVARDGFVMNLSRAWAHAPDLRTGVGALVERAAEVAGLTFRQRGVLISATASTLGDSYCALAWGTRLAGEVGADVAAAVITGDDDGLDAADAALARWTRQVARDPNGTTEADVEALRAAGFDDAQILGVTAFVALRLAFATVNDAVGARPDAEVVAAAPAEVRAAVTFGRPAEGS